MPERFKTVIIVSVLALAFWVFAEAESLSERTVNARLAIAADTASRDALRVTTPDFDGRVTVELRGPRAALDDLQRFFANPLALSPEDAGLAIADGTVTLELERVLQDLPRITAANVEVVSARPGQITVEILQLDTIDVPIAVRLQGVAAEANPTIAPATASVRIPARLTAEQRDEIQAVVYLRPAELQDATPGETATLQLPVVLSAGAAAQPNVTLLAPDAAAVSIAVRSTNASADLDAPLWATLPAGQAGQYALTIDPADRVVPVTISGPNEAVQRFESGEWGIVGVVALDGAQLLATSADEEINWFALAAGDLIPLPTTIDVDSEKQSVTIQIAPLADQ